MSGYPFIQPNVIQFVSARQREHDERWVCNQIAEKLERQLGPMVDVGILVSATENGLNTYRKTRNVDKAVEAALQDARELQDRILNPRSA